MRRPRRAQPSPSPSGAAAAAVPCRAAPPAGGGAQAAVEVVDPLRLEPLEQQPLAREAGTAPSSTAARAAPPARPSTRPTAAAKSFGVLAQLVVERLRFDARYARRWPRASSRAAFGLRSVLRARRAARTSCHRSAAAAAAATAAARPLNAAARRMWCSASAPVARSATIAQGAQPLQALPASFGDRARYHIVSAIVSLDGLERWLTPAEGRDARRAADVAFAELEAAGHSQAGQRDCLPSATRNAV